MMTEFNNLHANNHKFGPKKYNSGSMKNTLKMDDLDLERNNILKNDVHKKRNYKRQEGINHMSKSHISKRVLESIPSDIPFDEILSQIQELNENQLNQLITNVPVNYNEGFNESTDQIEFENLSNIQKLKYLESLNKEELALQIKELRSKEKEFEGFSSEFESPENVDDFLSKKKMYVAFLIFYFFELTIQNIYLLQLLREKVKRIKSVIFSCRVIPLIYYLSRILGDLIFTSFLYGIIYGALRLGAVNLIDKFNMENEFLNLWGLLFIWKMRYILIGYVLSHFIYGSIEQILKYYVYIYVMINGGFVVVAIYYPNIPFDYIFDSGSIWLYTFQKEFVLSWKKEIGALVVNFMLALMISTMIDTFKLNRNFWHQKKGRKEMKAKEMDSQDNSLNQSFFSDRKTI
jgi:hypothetical protein